MQSVRSGSPHNAGSRPPRESTLHASLPITPNHTTHKLCVSRLFDVVWAGRNTQSVTWSAFTLMFLCQHVMAPAHDVLPIVWTDYIWFRAWYRWRRSPSVSDAARDPSGNSNFSVIISKYNYILNSYLFTKKLRLANHKSVFIKWHGHKVVPHKSSLLSTLKPLLYWYPFKKRPCLLACVLMHYAFLISLKAPPWGRALLCRGPLVPLICPSSVIGGIFSVGSWVV